MREGERGRGSGRVRGSGREGEGGRGRVRGVREGEWKGEGG